MPGILHCRLMVADGNNAFQHLQSIYLCSMPRKIYFANKPLYLVDKITKEIESYQANKQAAILQELSGDGVKNLIQQLQEPSILAAVLFHADLEASYQYLLDQFKLIQAAGGFVYNDKEEVLLIFRRGKWDLPKGKLDEGEELYKCALREVEEETGLQGIELQKPLCITYHTYQQDGDSVLKESHWYLMHTQNDQVLTPQTEEDIEKCEWVNIKNMAPYMENTHPSILDVVQEGLAALQQTKAV